MMIGTTFLVIAGLIIAVWMVIELKRFKHKIFALFLIGLILFAYISSTIVFKGQDINFKSASGLSKASNLYFTWLGSFFGNVKTATGNVIKMDWGSKNALENSTND